MSKATKIETVLATWPDRNGVQYFGHADHGGHVDGCDSIWLSFRATNPADPCSWMNDDERAVSDIGLYIWFDEHGRVQAHFALHDLNNLRINEAEIRLKKLRWFDKRMPDVSRRCADNFRPMLMDVLGAVGVTRAIEYRHMVPSSKSTFVPVYDAVEIIAKEFDKRFNRIRKSA